MADKARASRKPKDQRILKGATAVIIKYSVRHNIMGGIEPLGKTTHSVPHKA